MAHSTNSFRMFWAPLRNELRFQYNMLIFQLGTFIVKSIRTRVNLGTLCA
jgi:hypothetical protein